MADLPTIMDASGLRPQLSTDLYAQLLAAVSLTNPGYTANLPGSMVDDIAGTAVGAILLCDAARVELVNSITPFGANAFILNQLGQMLGIAQGGAANTGVFVVFSGSVGYPISPGFTVSDGTNQYVVRDGGVIPAGGVSQPIAAIAAQPGSWAVPPGTVNQLVTSVSGAITLSVTNPLAGTPGPGAQTLGEYRAQVLLANKSASQGALSYLKTRLTAIPGVIARLVSVRQTGGAWEVIVGGTGDPYAIGYAIFRAVDFQGLVGSTLGVVGITNANPGVVTSSLAHGFLSGQVINIAGVVGMSGINGVALTITVLTANTFSIGINTTGLGAYASGGVITPNFRNITVNINDYPDVYTIPFVVPLVQNVTLVATWNTTQPGFVSSSAVVSLVQPALVGYINSIPAGAPINVFEMQAVFQTAITPILSPLVLTRMLFSVSINGVGVSPTAGTGIIAGDPESYFTTTLAGVVINQG